MIVPPVPATASPERIRTQILALVKEYHQAKFPPKSFDPGKDLVYYAGRVFDERETPRAGRRGGPRRSRFSRSRARHT